MLPHTNYTLASIVVVSYNSRDDIERCLYSIQSTLPVECEVILVDNASTDGSAHFVARRFPQVRLIALSNNLGFAGANNLGVGLARGHYIVALNPDTEVRPGWLQALLEPLVREEARRSPGAQCMAVPTQAERPVGLTTARIVMMSDPNRVNTCGNAMHQTGITVCRGLGLSSEDPAVSRECEVTAVSGACFAMPRLLWQRLGGLDMDFFMYLEDTDLSLRARLAGYRCVYTPGAVVLHNYTGRFTHQKLYYLERNRLMMLAKCLHPLTLIALLPSLVAAELVAWGYALKCGPRHIWAKLSAYRWLVGNWRLLREKRAQTVENKTARDVEVLAGINPALDMEQLAGAVLGKAADVVLNPLFWLNLALVSFVLGKASNRNAIAPESDNSAQASASRETAFDAA